jgi:hypothetical protein
LGGQKVRAWLYVHGSGTMSTGVCGPDGIPILKRLTALEPELAIPTPPKTEAEITTLEEETDDDIIDSAADEKSASVSLNTPIGGTVEMPIWIWLSVAIVCLAYLWGIAYALTPTRSVYPS